MSTSARFSKIVVIQSIPEGELHTGTRLHEDMQIRELYHDRGFNPELHNITSTKELRDLLSELEQKARRDGDWPILHVEAHGNTDGLVLASKEFISWEALKPALIALNVATKNNLLLTLAACYGGYLTKTLLPLERAPCWALVGPVEGISAGALLDSFIEFYDELYATGNGSAALKRLNTSVNADKLSYTFSQCAQMFKLVYRRYLEEQFSPKVLRKRVESVNLQLKQQGRPPKGGLAEIKKKLLSTRELYFNKHKEIFFMTDLYPENSKRFMVTYQDVLHF